jgi:CelD/BcsL family acetyltransferase involved in cellulose biosynthesis
VRRGPHHATARLPGGLVAALRPLDPDAPWVAAWTALGPRSLVANPFYEAACALASRRAFGAGIRLLIVADRPPEEPGARLLAVWPHRRVKRWGLPLAVLLGWTHGYAPVGVPLLDRDRASDALAALLAAPRALGEPARMLLPNAPTEGVFADLLAATRLRQASYWRIDRGYLDPSALPPETRAAYLDHLSGNRKRRLRKARRRLDGDGTVTFDLLADPAVLLAAVDAHVALEGATWKARAGTSLVQRPDEADLLRGAVAGLAREDRVRIARLRRGDELLASMILPVVNGEAFVLKVASDDRDAAAATGVQLVHRLTEAVVAGCAITKIDSCAPPDFPLATLFWTERKPVVHLLLEAGHDPFFPVAERMERVRAWAARTRLAWKAGAAPVEKDGDAEQA